MNFPDDDVDITPENSEISCLKTQSLRVDEENDATHSLNNNTLPLNPRVAVSSLKFYFTLKFYFRLNGKISSIK